MGNHMSCVSPAALKRLQAASNSSSQDLIKLLHCDTSTVSELEGPITAAEVMMEFPAQFLACFSKAMSNGRRICAVPAHEELHAMELYLLLPMQKLNTRFSSEEMEFFATLAARDNAKSPSKGAISQSKVAPYPASMASLQSSNGEIVVGRSMKSFSFKKVDEGVRMDLQGAPALMLMRGGTKNGMCRSKSWIPKLQTIRETAAA